MTWRKAGGRGLLSLALSLALAFALVPAISPAQPAWADESTTDYTVFFTGCDLNGSGVFLPSPTDANSFRVASTYDDPQCAKRSDNLWESGAGLLSKEKIDFSQDWVIKFDVKCPKPAPVFDASGAPITASTSAQINIAFANDAFADIFSGRATTGNVFRLAAVYRWGWNYASRDYDCKVMAGDINSSGWNQTTGQQVIYQGQGAGDAINGAIFNQIDEIVHLTMSYDSVTDKATLTVDNGVTIGQKKPQVVLDNARTTMNGSAYLSIIGGINWINLPPKDADRDPRPSEQEMDVTFKSMELPHLSPSISEVVLTDLNGRVIEKDDKVEPGTIVKVTCKIKNTDGNSVHKDGAGGVYNEQFPLYLRLAPSDSSCASKGIDPIFSNDYPFTVAGKNETTTAAAQFTNGSGVALTLVGTQDVEVTYYAEINQSPTEAVVLGHELVEDFFKGSHLTKNTLFLPLIPGDNTSGEPGKDYHYTRFPAANANGWNNASTYPVNIQFFAGDFDSFTVSDTGGTALSTLSDNQIWSQGSDVDALPVTLQAHNSSTGSSSSKNADTIRIDTHVPELSYDAATGTLQATDSASGTSVSSGIWKIERVKADGRSLDTQNITPQAVALTASATASQSSWTFALTNGKGAPSQALTNVDAGYYVAEDAAGNRSKPFQVRETSEPTYPDITSRPTSSKPSPQPLPPTRVDIDPETGAAHAYMEDELSLPCSDTAITPAMMADIIWERYIVGTGLSDSTVSSSTVTFYDEQGNPVETIDRTKPGLWYAEQTFTDSDGNRTTLRLTVTILQDSATGTMGPGPATWSDTIDSSDNPGGKTTVGPLLPQTGGIFGPCPLHLLFVLMMLMAASYTFMRLQQERRELKERSTPADQGGKLMHHYHALDALVHGVIVDGALILVLFSMCPEDLIYGLATTLVVVVCAVILARGPRTEKSDAPDLATEVA